MRAINFTLTVVSALFALPIPPIQPETIPPALTSYLRHRVGLFGRPQVAEWCVPALSQRALDRLREAAGADTSLARSDCVHFDKVLESERKRYLMVTSIVSDDTSTTIDLRVYSPPLRWIETAELRRKPGTSFVWLHRLTVSHFGIE